MKYIKSEKYNTPELQAKIMEPNPVKFGEELLRDCKIKEGGKVCDLGSGQGLTSVFIAKEYGYKVYATDLWSDPMENKAFFEKMGLNEDKIVAVKAEAESLPYEKEFFDGVISIDSYNYFGRDDRFLDEKLLPFVKKGGYIYIAIPSMIKDCHDKLPEELLLSWTPEQLEYMHDVPYWRAILEKSRDSELIKIGQMESNEEVWADWLKQDNEYAINDRKSMENGGGKYLGFIEIVLRKNK